MQTATHQPSTANGAAEAPSTALALRLPDPALDPYQPRDLAEAVTLATKFTASKLTRCRTAEQALLLMATGRDLGISPTTALRMIYVADFGQGDQVALSADLMVALCLRARGICEYFRCIEATDERAVYECKRAGDPPRQMPFTNEDRIKAKLGFSKDGKESPDSNWAKYRRTMLMHRAASLLAREVFPDLVGGFYTDEELRDMAEARTAAPAAPVSALPTQPEPVDAEVIESDEARIVAALGEAQTTAALASLAAEAQKIWPKARPAEVSAAYSAAKARIDGKPKADLFGDRQPGSDDE